ncbi:MAG TPA: shikimate kinase [Gemmatimonadaceae bacterium]|nr:shikimate kinase [Gemmatimonadaceae bacterium]
MAAEPDAPHLIFVGLAGSGKSTVGRAVADRLGRPFLDLDQEIVRREAVVTVGEIFRTKGESYFRGLEGRLTAELAHSKGLVVAPGGGWIMTPANVDLVRPVSYLIYLRVTPETALQRVGADRGNRPLLDHPNPLAQLEDQLLARGPRYEEADFVIDTETITGQEVIEKVLSKIRAG